jgi:DNA end-binding protein Ku
MRGKDRVAVGRWAARGKEQLVLVRPYGDKGLILHQLYYADEVRSFEDVDTGAKLNFSDKERELADKLIEQLSSEAFEPEKYHDTYSDRVRAAVEQKVQGEQVTVPPEAPKAQIIDLFEALKKSLENMPDKAGRELKPPKKVGSRPKADAKKKTTG